MLANRELVLGLIPLHGFCVGHFSPSAVRLFSVRGL